MAGPLKSYIDRILNVLAEIDEKGSDKKEIYKELANEGYDRTVVSQVVGHIRKKTAKPGKFAEQSQLFDLYLADYEGVGTVVATHTLHADHDPDTGEIIEPAEHPAADSGEGEPSAIMPAFSASHSSEVEAHDSEVDRSPVTTTAPAQLQTGDRANGGGSDEAVEDDSNSTQQAGAGEGETSSAPGHSNIIPITRKDDGLPVAVVAGGVTVPHHGVMRI